MVRLRLLLIGLMCVGQPALAHKICPDDEKDCNTGYYFHDAGPSGPKEDCEGGVCRDDAIAPNKVVAVCDYTAPWFTCKIWPQGPGLMYHWDSPNGALMAVNGATPLPYQSFLCNKPNGFAEAEATVAAPSGASATVVVKIACTPGETGTPSN